MDDVNLKSRQVTLMSMPAEIEVKRSSSQMTYTSGSCNILLVLAMCLQLFVCINQNWFVLKIDLNNCLSCGRMIVDVGGLMENTSDVYDQLSTLRDVINVSMDTATATTKSNANVNANSNVTKKNRSELESIQQGLYPDNDTGLRFVANDTSSYTFFDYDPASVYESAIDDFEISNQLFVTIGLWCSTICTGTRSRCVNVGLQSSRNVFAQLGTMVSIHDRAIESRLFLLVSMSVMLFTLFVVFFDLSTPTPTQFPQHLIIYGGTVSGALGIVSVLAAMLPYFNLLGDSVISPSMPWAIAVMMTSSYVTLFVVTSTIRQLRNLQLSLLDCQWKQYKVI